MKDELRIYYGSVEQAHNYIEPILSKNLKKIDIKLIKLKKDYSLFSKGVAPLIYWKDPDILITMIKNNNEIPLVMIEFSNAVFTEDHELQRFDGLVAAAKNNCLYVKISPLKKLSQSGEHGGNIKFNAVEPYAAILKKFGLTFYHFDWKCDSKGDLIVDDEFLSCPKDIKDFELFLKELSKIISDPKVDGKSWIKKLEERLDHHKYFSDWNSKLKDCNFSDKSKLNSSRTKWNPLTSELTLKLNRFGHAMDPERGMLAYYGTIVDNVVGKMCFSQNNTSWYNSTSSENRIREYIRTNSLKIAFDYLYCFIYGSALNNVQGFSTILEFYKDSKENLLEIDLKDIIKNNYFNLNKPMRTIFRDCKYFIICDENDNLKIKLKWNNFSKNESFRDNDAITKIDSRKELDEDDVTYITVHNILKPNKYKVMAASYPCAQGDRVILVSPGTGRGQQRSYLDVVAYLPNKHTAIQENKGKFSIRDVKEDIDKIALFKKNQEHKDALNIFIRRYDNKAPKIIKIGVGFWANKNFKMSNIKDLKIEDLDYFVYIDDKISKWQIWSSGSKNLFKKTSGKVDLPKTYVLS